MGSHWSEARAGYIREIERQVIVLTSRVAELRQTAEGAPLIPRMAFAFSMEPFSAVETAVLSKLKGLSRASDDESALWDAAKSAVEAAVSELELVCGKAAEALA